MAGAFSLFGRLCIAAIFVISGVAKIPGWQDNLGYMTQNGVPSAQVFLTVAILIEVLGGLMVASGFRTRIAALVLALYLIPVTVTFHHFWNLSGVDRQMQMVNFLKNLAILGGLLGYTAFGAGGLSIDAMRRRRRQAALGPGLRRIA